MFCKTWLAEEIAQYRDPDVNLALKKATAIRAESTGEFMDTAKVRPSWLSQFKDRNPDIVITPARSLEEVCF